MNRDDIRKIIEICADGCELMLAEYERDIQAVISEQERETCEKRYKTARTGFLDAQTGQIIKLLQQ